MKMIIAKSVLLLLLVPTWPIAIGFWAISHILRWLEDHADLDAGDINYILVLIVLLGIFGTLAAFGYALSYAFIMWAI